MKQTAVEWLVEQIEKYRALTRDSAEKVINQAKEMEKEQMKALYSMWMVDKKTMELYDFEQYYNETFGK